MRSSATGALQGVTFTDQFFTKGAKQPNWQFLILKKLSVLQEGNRITYGPYAPEGGAGLVGGLSDETKKCLEEAMKTVNNGFTGARTARARASYGSAVPGGCP